MRLIASYAPRYFLFFVPQVLLSSFLSLLSVYVPKLIIECLTDKTEYRRIVMVIALFCIALFFVRGLMTILEKKNRICVEKFNARLMLEIGSIAMDLNLSALESTSQKDNIRLAGNASATIGILETIKQMIQNAITLVGYILIIAQYNVLYFVVVAALLLVKIAFTAVNYRKSIAMMMASAKNDRVGDYLTSICYFHQGAAKEIRVNGIQGWFLNKVRAFRLTMVHMQYQDFKRIFLFNMIEAVLYACSSYFILYSLSNFYMAGRLSLANFSLLFSTITATSAVLGALTDLVSQYNRQLQNVADFEALRALSEEGSAATEQRREYLKTGETVSIVFSHVWFSYPGCDDYVLENINLQIGDREKLVVVGYNGAGKSTLIKLLCKFYRPTLGTITLNGTDIWDIPDEQYYPRIGAVFQDYTTFAFTIAENITMREEKDDISRVLSEVDLDEFVNGLPNGTDTYLSKKFSSDGMEISGGQGQRIALARALYKNALLLILDEPTASLDVKAESQLYEKFMQTAKDKTAIFISHRLTASQIADKIVVLSGGKIAEYGTHRELMQRQGLYAVMFQKQSEAYI